VLIRQGALGRNKGGAGWRNHRLKKGVVNIQTFKRTGGVDSHLTSAGKKEAINDQTQHGEKMEGDKLAKGKNSPVRAPKRSHTKRKSRQSLGGGEWK